MPDVHVALHFKRFDQIDWRTLMAADAVTILVTPPFMSELDDKKNGAKGTLQKRARMVSSWLGERLDAAGPCVISEGVDLVFLTEEPELSVDFAAHRLVPSNLDDRYIACILAEQAREPGLDVVFVTTDNIAKAKAKAKAIRYVEPPNDTKQRDEPDEHEKELAEVKKRLARFENATSDLRLSFVGNGNHASMRVSVPVVQRSELELDLRRHQMRWDLFSKQKGFLLSVQPLGPRLKDRNTYLNERRDWLQRFLQVAVERARTIPLRLSLSNVEGRAPARNVQIELTLPAGVGVRSAAPRELPEPPRMVLPPIHERRSALENLVAPPSTGNLLSALARRNERLQVDPRVPRQFRFEVDALNHHAHAALPVVALAFDSVESIGSFSLKYRILSATQPDPGAGDLHFEVVRHEHRLEFPDDPHEAAG